ncbi:MAG: metabolite traffic protein EboE [Phycisphaerales bacterium]|jgi:hypothetical protein|nr:metabolite traffic protein EboE [Phycisphaerales bacterium]
MLGYCTNVHSGNSFFDVIENLKKYSSAVQENFQKPLGIGLWLSDKASQEVDTELLEDILQEHNLEVFTLNGFPFSDFHQDIVKHRVYKPNWSEEPRLDYTVQLANILSKIIKNKEAGISTLPLGWNSASFENRDCIQLLETCVEALEEIEQQTEKCIHLDIETEPGCRLQTSEDLCNFINKYFGDSERIRRYIRICHDTCHSVVMRENVHDCITNYKNAGLSIGKVQLSSAIEIDFNGASSQKLLSDITSISEPRYLHQTSVFLDGNTKFYDNITDIPKDNPSGVWRVHFHVPIHLDRVGELCTTQNELKSSISALKEAGATTWEVETYTWDVAPNSMKDVELVDSIVKELRWASNQINK